MIKSHWVILPFLRVGQGRIYAVMSSNLFDALELVSALKSFTTIYVKHRFITYESNLAQLSFDKDF